MLEPSIRQIAIQAIAGRATGNPAAAATEILVGIAVLDGQHLPILLWPNDLTREEKAAWHAAEAAFWSRSAARFSEPNARDSQSAARTHSETQGVQSTGEQVVPQLLSASSVQAPHEVEAESPVRSQFGEHLQGSSDAC